MKTPFITCGASAGCRQRRPVDSRWRMRRSARACAPVRARGSTASSATCCRSPAMPPARIGRRAPGSCARERCYLIPGDSPHGLPAAARLPAVGAPGDRPHLHAPDPTQAFPPLAADTRRFASSLETSSPGARGGHRASRAPRDARVGTLDHAHRHVRRAASTACCTSSCRRPIASRIISSWSPRSKPPPSRCRSRWSWKATSRRVIRVCSSFRVTPDPGVIEVNIHPASRWDELVERTTHLYEQRVCRA